MPGDDVIMVNDRRVLLRKQVAARVGISPETWHSYVSRRLPKANPAPRHDGEIDGRTPYWWPETVDAWQARRRPASRDVD